MIRKIIVLGLIAAITLIVATQFFLAYGLTDSMRKWVLPAIKNRYNTDVTVKNVSVNLFGGSLSINNIHVASPEGFNEASMVSIERCGLKIGLPALLKGGGASIEKAVVKNAIFTVVRNRNGVLNLEPVLTAMKQPPRQEQDGSGKDTSKTEAERQEASGATAASLPNIVIKTMELMTKLNYTDWTIGQPFNLGIELDLRLSNIANYGPDETLSGVLNLHGNIIEQNNKPAFDVKGRISPITDPLFISFELDGAFQKTDLKTFKGLIENIGLQGGNVSGTMTLVCHKGQFNPEKSVLRMKFSDIVLTREKADKMRGIPMPSAFNVLVPVSGPLANPQINVTEAFIKTITSEDMVDSIIKGIVNQDKTANDSENDKKANEPASRKSPDFKSIFGDILGGK